MLRGLTLALFLLLGATATALADAGEDCDKGSGDIAIRGCTELIRRNPRNASAYYNRGFEYKAKGDVDLALADYTKAIEIDPKFAMAYNSRGDTWRIKGENDRAVADLNKAIELNPKFVPVYKPRQRL